MASKLRVPVEVFQTNVEFLVEQIDVTALQKHLHGHQLLQPLDSEAEEVLNSDDFPAADKAGYLVQRAISFGNRGVNELIKVLEAERTHVGHTRVLAKLQADAQDFAKKYSPVLFVLDDVAEKLPLGVDIRMLQVSLMNMGIISSVDIHGSRNPSMRDRVTHLVTVVKEKGVDGLVKLLQSLEQIKQAEFAESLRKRVQEMIDEGCTLNEKDSKILQEAKFRVHVPSRLPSQAVSSSSQPVQVHRSSEVHCDSGSEYAERVVVMISMATFLVLEEGGEEMIEENFDGDYQLSNSLKLIRDMLKQMNFTVVDLGSMLADVWRHEQKADRLRKMVTEFQNRVSACCSSTCQVIILITGVAFSSHKDQKTRLLIEGSPKFSKHVGDCITEEQLKSCLDTLSTPYVTVIADNHVEIEQMSQGTSPQNVFFWRNLCTNNPQRVVISYCYKVIQKQARMEQSFGLMMSALVHFLTDARHNADSALISHRQLCDMLSLYCTYKLGTNCNILPCVQGDVDRGLFGNNNYPYLLYFPVQISVSAPSSSPISFEVKHIDVPYGKMLGLTDESSVKIGHMCRPTELVSGNVFDLKSLSCKVDVEEVEKLQQLLKDIYTTVFGEIDHNTREKFHLLCVYPSYNSTSSQRSPVAVDSPDPEEELREYTCNQSQLLRLTADTEKAVLKVRKRGDEYIVKDGWGDIKMTSQVSNMQQVKSILEMYARFKMVKKLLRNNDPKVEHHASLQTCVLYQYKPSPLLTVTKHQNGEFTHPTAFFNPSQNTEGFWSLETDSSTIDVFFSKIRLINSVEVKGDSISFDKIEYRSKCSLVNERSEVPKSETPVRFPLKRRGKSDIVVAQCLKLSMVAQEEEEYELCGMSFRVFHHFNQTTNVLKRMRLTNHNELVDARYTIKPLTHDGSIVVDEEWVVITAPRKMSHIPLEFDFLGKYNLAFLELKHPSNLSAANVQPVKEIRIECFPKWNDPRLPTSSIFSTATFDFRNPVRASHLRLVPEKNKTVQKMCVQLQVYGNQSSEGESLIVNEGDDIQVGFAYSYSHNVYLNIVCMEETGMVSCVLSMKKLKECPKSDGGIAGWLEDHSQFIHTFIPDNYPLRGSEIRDTYKVIVSSQPLDLNPLCQSGANDYYSPRILDLASIISDVAKDSGFADEPWWYDHEVHVRVQRTKRQE